MTTIDEMDRLIGQLVPAHAERGGLAIDATYLLIETAVRNALRWSADKRAYVAWALRAERLELAVGDTGPGIAATFPASTTATALESVFSRYLNARPQGGLTRLHDFLRRDAYQRDGYAISGDEEHECRTYRENFTSLGLSGLIGPTVVALSL